MKAIALFSGGLDSALAIKLIQGQNIEVKALYVNIGFDSNEQKTAQLKKLADSIGVEFESIDIRDEYIKEVLLNPVYGYGKNMNPCIDCHAKMIRIALEVMKKVNANFIISGEVVDQRPMSQKLHSLNAVSKLSGHGGLLLRPLSAKLLPPTIPEVKGWVDREKLLGISGRDRKVQLELAKKYNLEGFESPSGGCLLTDISFSKRLKNFIKHLPFSSEEINILKAGRHFDVEGVKIIISRNKGENLILKDYKGSLFQKMTPLGFKGPIGLISKNTDQKVKQLAADMLVSYTKVDKGNVKISDQIFTGRKTEKDKFKKYLI